MRIRRRTRGESLVKVAAVVEKERGVVPVSNVVDAARAFAG
jgi:hypothetical protein